jgi:hypothetical protein
LDTRNKIAKAIRIRQQIVQQNQLCMRKSLSLRCMLDQKKEPEKLVEETKLEEQTEALITEKKTQTYLDLFRHKEIRMPLCALLYCFATSSIVSFGFYFTTEVGLYYTRRVKRLYFR